LPTSTDPDQGRLPLDVPQRANPGDSDQKSLLGLRVGEANGSEPTAQSSMLEHDDPAWMPPGEGRLTVDMNHGRPRIYAGLDAIVEVVDPGLNSRSWTATGIGTKEGLFGSPQPGRAAPRCL